MSCNNMSSRAPSDLYLTFARFGAPASLDWVKDERSFDVDSFSADYKLVFGVG
jgi:hypothetical protein